MNISLDSAGDVLTTGDICELLKLSNCHVRRMLRSGELPGVKIGARWYVPKSSLEEIFNKAKGEDHGAK